MLTRFKAWFNRQQPMSEENQRSVLLYAVLTVTVGMSWWVVTIPNGDYMLAPEFRQDLRMEIAYIPQIWSIRKHASY